MTEVQRLLDRIEQLQQVIGADSTLVSKLRNAFGLERDHAVMLGMLYQRELVTRDGLYVVLYGDAPEHSWPNDKIMDQRLHGLRTALERHGVVVQTIRGEGWRISKEAKVKVCEAVSDPSEEQVLERYRQVFRLQPKQAQILAMMMDKPSVTATTLQGVVSGFGAARLQIHRMRRKLDQFGITITGDYGRWSLSERDRVNVETLGNSLLSQKMEA